MGLKEIMTTRVNCCMIIVYLYSRSDLFKFENWHFAWKYHSFNPVSRLPNGGNICSVSPLPALCLLWCCPAQLLLPRLRSETRPVRWFLSRARLSATTGMPTARQIGEREGEHESDARRGQEPSPGTGLTWVGPVSPVLSAVSAV